MEKYKIEKCVSYNNIFFQNGHVTIIQLLNIIAYNDRRMLRVVLLTGGRAVVQSILTVLCLEFFLKCM